jgi:PKD repeat protein
MGTSLSFIDSSENAVEYRWDFGDGKTDTVSNPVHSYSAAGRYVVNLYASNFCNIDTASRIVDVIDVQNFFPRRGGNTGSVEVSVVGAGFNEQTTVSLVLNGEKIEGINTYSTEDGKHLITTFELYEARQGTWDLVIENLSSSLLIPASFKVELGTSPKIVANIEGRDVIRQNRAEKITFTFSNDGNTDARGVPIWFAVPRGTKVELDFHVYANQNSDNINYDTVDFHIEEDSLFGMPNEVDIYGFIVRSIPAGSRASYPA